MKTMDEYVLTETVCFTGHRTIPPAEVAAVRERTALAVLEAYENGYRTFLCGGARGFDTIVAQEILKLKKDRSDIRLVIAVPCLSQADKWSAMDRKTYHSILKRADKSVILTETYYNGCMQNRNRYMVDHASLCMCYLTKFEGGTWSTVRYALHKDVPVINLAMYGKKDTVMKEHSWNSICISRSVQKNVSIVHLSHSCHLLSKKMNT